MASNINEAAYETMIGALNSFASKITELAGNLGAASDLCRSALSDDDAAIEPLCEKVKVSKGKYEACAATAKSIAGSMAEELEEARRERQVWSGND